jgi:hypothetical protein
MVAYPAEPRGSENKGVTLTSESLYYSVPYLAGHLYAAEDFERLHLLISPIWMERRFLNDGDYSGFLGDVGLAWESTLLFARPQIALQIRYALIQTTIRSLAVNVPAELFPLLIDEGLWTFSQAMTFAQLKPKVRDRSEALLAISRSSAVSETERRSSYVAAMKALEDMPWILRDIIAELPIDLLAEATALADGYVDLVQRQRLLSSIVLRLPDQERAGLLEKAIELARNLATPEDRAEALLNLGSLLSPTLLKETLDQISLIESIHSRCSTLSRLAVYLPLELLRDAKWLAEQALITNAEGYVQVLVSLATRRAHLMQVPETASATDAPKILDRERPQELDEALRIAHSIKKPYERQKAFVLLSDAMPELQDEVFVMALLSDTTSNEAFNTGILSTRLRPDLQDRVLHLIRETKEVSTKRSIIKGVAWQLDDERLLYAIDAASTIVDHQEQIAAMVELTVRLSKAFQRPWIDEIYRRVSRADDEQIRSEVISSFTRQRQAPTGDAQLDYKAQSMETKISEFTNRLVTNSGRGRADWGFNMWIANHVSELDDETVVHIIRHVIQHDWSRSTSNPRFPDLLSKLASRISPELMREVMDYTLRKLSAADRDNLVRPGSEQLDCAYLCILADLAPHLSTLLLSDVARKLQSLPNDIVRACASLCLVPNIGWFASPELIALSRLEVSGKSDVRMISIAETCANHTYTQLDSIVSRVLEIPYYQPRKWTLLSLLPHLPTKYIDQVLPECITAASRGSWIGLLEQFALLRIIDFIPAVSCDQIMQALDVINYAEEVRRATLEMLANRLLRLPDETKFRQWNMLLRRLADQGRTEFLQELQLFSALVQSLADDQTLDQTITFIKDIERWTITNEYNLKPT